MSSRTRKLAEIAKANEPVFSGDPWWLSDASVKKEVEPATQPAAAGPIPEPEPAAVALPEIGDSGDTAVVEVPAEVSPDFGMQEVMAGRQVSATLTITEAHVPFAAAEASLAVATATEAEAIPAAASSPAPADVAQGAPVQLLPEPAAGNEPMPVQPDFPARLSGLREKFLWLGRRKRASRFR